RTIKAHMQNLGYRHAPDPNVVEGIAVNNDHLIITFNVTEGPLTRVAEIEIRGEKAFSKEVLRKQINSIVGGPYSRQEARADTDRLLNFYAREGYIDAEVQPSTDPLPNKGADEQVRLVFTITKEGAKGIVNEIVINGVTGSAAVQRAKRDAIR